ncbi:MAG: hypothetical protein ACRDDL_08030 [Sarcina sp.]
MIKRIIIFVLILVLGISFFGVRKISKEMKKRKGLTEVSISELYKI